MFRSGILLWNSFPAWSKHLLPDVARAYLGSVLHSWLVINRKNGTLPSADPVRFGIVFPGSHPSIVHIFWWAVVSIQKMRKVDHRSLGDLIFLGEINKAPQLQIKIGKRQKKYIYIYIWAYRFRLGTPARCKSETESVSPRSICPHCGEPACCIRGSSTEPHRHKCGNSRPMAPRSPNLRGSESARIKKGTEWR